MTMLRTRRPRCPYCGHGMSHDRWLATVYERVRRWRTDLGNEWEGDGQAECPSCANLVHLDDLEETT